MNNFKYNEAGLVQELMEYIEDTYDEHYSKKRFQTAEIIFDSGYGKGFTIGNIMKYAQRYGKKGSPEEARKDLMKVLHYGIMALYLHDQTINGDIEDDGGPSEKKFELRMEK
jgi:hypothetical protein